MKKICTDRLQLNVESGLHAGAEIPFPINGNGVIGSHSGAAIFIADTGFPTEAVVLEFDESQNVVKLRVLTGGVKIFNYKLPEELQVRLISGTRFSIANVEFSITAVVSKEGVSDLSCQRSIGHKKARRFFLMQFNRREYFFAAVKQMSANIYVYVVCMAAVVIIAWLLNGLLVRTVDGETEKQYSEELISKFKDVIVTIDPGTGIPSYTGHVDDQGQLNELRELVFKLNIESLVSGVMPMDIMAFNARAFLEHYYRDPRISISGPGELRVRVMGKGSMNILGAWDFASVESLAKRAIPGLNRLYMVLTDPAEIIVKTPLSGTGLSIISSDASAPFVIDTNSKIYFEGAVLKQGRILKILPCSIQMEVPGEQAVFELTAQKWNLANGCR